MPASWDIGPTNDGPPDPDTRCPICGRNLEDGEHDEGCTQLVPESDVSPDDRPE